jgi:hypothetical protein
MVKLNIHALYSDLTVVYTLIVLCICQQQNGIRRCITVDRYLYIIQFDIHNGMASLSLSQKKCPKLLVFCDLEPEPAVTRAEFAACASYWLPKWYDSLLCQSFMVCWQRQVSLFRYLPPPNK